MYTLSTPNPNLTVCSQLDLEVLEFQTPDQSIVFVNTVTAVRSIPKNTDLTYPYVQSKSKRKRDGEDNQANPKKKQVHLINFLSTPHIHPKYTPPQTKDKKRKHNNGNQTNRKKKKKVTPCTPYVHSMYTLCTPHVTLCTPHVHLRRLKLAQGRSN